MRHTAFGVRGTHGAPGDASKAVSEARPWPRQGTAWVAHGRHGCAGHGVAQVCMSSSKACPDVERWLHNPMTTSFGISST